MGSFFSSIVGDSSKSVSVAVKSGGAEVGGAGGSSMFYGASALVNITNGVCSFDPTSRRGKWMFLIQTLLLSFAPISILIVQNSINFSEVLLQKQYVQNKTSMVRICAFFSANKAGCSGFARSKHAWRNKLQVLPNKKITYLSFACAYGYVLRSRKHLSELDVLFLRCITVPI